MRGMRPLTEAEITLVETRLAPRDKALFILGYRSGFRISELLSLRVEDVKQHDCIVDRITVARCNMKKKISSRTILLHPKAKEAILAWLNLSNLTPKDFLFKSKKGGPISRIQAYRILMTAYNTLKLTGKLGTHSMRKSYCDRMYKALDKDLVKLQKAMGHASINSTVQYLSFNEEELDEAILSI